MKYMNRVTIIGSVGKDPDFRTTSNGLPIANFSVATTRKVKEVDITQWHRCVAFNDLARNIAKSVFKGTKVHIEGEIQYQDYEVSGEKKYVTKIMIQEISLPISSFADEGSGNGNSMGNHMEISKNQDKSYFCEDEELPF